MHEQEKGKLPLPKLLAVITDRERIGKVSDLFRCDHIGLQYVLPAFGTASSEVMDLLGLGQTDKAIVLCLGADFRITELLETVHKKFNLAQPGKGIAFTIPLSGVSGAVLKLLGEEKAAINLEHKMENEVEGVKGEIKHDLVLAVINQGYSEELMTAAKAVGARGGTVFHARRIANEEAIKFFGISLQAEKEVVAIITPREAKHDIMQAICQQCGMTTEAKGIVISLPVDGVAGIF